MAVIRWIVTVGLVLALAGCGSGDEAEQGAATPSQPEAASPSATPSATGAPALTGDVLLTDADMPAWNGAIIWVPTDTAWTDVLRLCAVPTPEGLGAVSAVSVQYQMTAAETEGVSNVADPNNVGGNAVLRFADDAAAAAAQAQVAAAVESCVPEGGMPTEPFVLTRADGIASWSWAAQPAELADGNMLLFEFLGVGRSGDELTMVAMAIAGMDANYSGDPLWTSLQLSLTRLG